MIDEGWIKLHRKLIEREWFDDANTLKVWLWLLCSANHDVGRWMGYEIPRGSLITSYDKMAKKLRLSPQKIRTVINHLKSTGEITSKSTNKNTIITICKYDTYQCCGNVEQQTKQQAKQLSSNKQLTTNKNNKNNKNIKEINKEKEIQKAQDAFRYSLMPYLAIYGRQRVWDFFTKYSTPEIGSDGCQTGRLLWQSMAGWNLENMIKEFSKQ